MELLESIGTIRSRELDSGSQTTSEEAGIFDGSSDEMETQGCIETVNDDGLGLLSDAPERLHESSARSVTGRSRRRATSPLPGRA